MSSYTQLNRIVAAKPFFPEQDIKEIQGIVDSVLRSGRLILGKHTQQFEQSFRNYIGTSEAVAVNSCTSALQIAMRFANVKGKEVIVPTNNFIGVVSAIVEEGGIPVLVDMDPHSFCIDTEGLLNSITENTACIIVVDIAGLIYPDIKKVKDICENAGIMLIEDASHAHGAALDGEKAGNITEVGCFSFYPTKIITTGTGGMLTTSNPELAEYARSVRHHGAAASLENVVNFGNDWCLGEIQAAIGNLQLARLDANLAHRRKVVAQYKSALEHLSWLNLPSYPANFEHAYYKFPTLLREDIDAEQFRRSMFEEYQVENGAIYNPPCHLQPVLRNQFGYKEGMFPVAESVLSRQFCPPIHSSIASSEVERVIDAVIKVGEKLV